MGRENKSSWFPKTQTLSERKSFLCINEQFLIIQVIPDRQGKFLCLEFSRGAVCTTQIYPTFSLWQYRPDSKHTMQ